MYANKSYTILLIILYESLSEIPDQSRIQLYEIGKRMRVGPWVSNDDL